MSTALDFTNYRDRDRRLFGPTIHSASVAELRTIAEDPFSYPSERVAARRELIRRRQEAEETVGPVILAERLKVKIAAGQGLTWRERSLAEQFKLVPKRSDVEDREKYPVVDSIEYKHF